MAANLMGPVGRGGTNQPLDVRTVQTLLNNHRLPPLQKITVDGIIGPNTIAAIEEFQRRVVKMLLPDGRVDPGGKTLKALDSGAVATPSPTVGLISVKFSHGNKQPTGVTGLPGASTMTTSTRYESTVAVSGGLTGNFRGSIYPDNMNVKGRLNDGTYDIYLGFHKPGVPQSSDLVVRTNGFRAVLVVNANNSVPVTSNLASKTTSTAIHIHNGYNSWVASTPMSEGCLILHPSDWPAFIKLFLDKFPNIQDWKSSGDRLGKKIGSVTVGV
jgi:hypothetical protein